MAYDLEYVNKKVKFKNVHGNYHEPFVGIARLYNNPLKSGWEAYNETSESIRDIIEVAINKNYRLRACGSLWSLSKAPYVNGIHIFNWKSQGEEVETMKFHHFMTSVHLDKPSPEDNTFLFAQCGNRIRDLNILCYDSGRSLMTTGASDGQTIGGCIGTGVHGSAINVGCIQDTVYGLHIITGTEAEDSIYLEAETNPIANQAFADKINARLIRDNDLFNAALVGLGAFGYVHGVVVKTAPAFTLFNYTRKISLDNVY